MKGPFMGFICKIAWLVTALCAINMGLIGLGYDFFNTDMMKNMGDSIVYVYYALGIMGVISLIAFFCCLAKKGCCCGKNGCCSPSSSSSRLCPKCGAVGGCNCR